MTQTSMDIGGDLIDPLDEPEFDLRGIVDVLRRHWKLILATLVAVVAAAGLLLVAIPPTFTASTLILVDPGPKDLLDPNQPASDAGTENARVESEAELVRSEATLVRAITALNLTTDTEFGPHPGLVGRTLSLVGISPELPQSPEAVLLATVDNLREALSVQRRGLTYLIAIEVGSGDPAKAALIANAIATSHIEEQLNAKIQQSLASRDIIQSRVAEAADALSQAEAAVDAFETEARDELSGGEMTPEMLTRLYELQQSADIARSQYQALLARLHDFDAQAYLQVPDSRVVSEALPPNSPSFPNPPLILAVAGVLALGLGVLLAFLLENYVGGFTSEAQTQAVLRAKVVAAMPRQRADKRVAGEATIADYVLHSPLSPFAESVRRIRVGIDRAIRAKSTPGGITVMVSSAAPGEGKTTVALSLARAYALSGRSTLLIDCDLRKPSVHRQLGLEPSNGLIDYLSHGKRPAPAIDTFMTMDQASGAQVIVGSRRSDVPTDELVSSRTFARLVDAARQNFDIVIIDTPPLGPVVDGLYLAPLADAIVFVVRWTRTSQQEARRGLASLEDAKRPDAKVLTVLNQQEGGLPGSSGKYAAYYSAGT